MWIFLARAGFYSVVQRDGHRDQLVIRARVEADLARLRELYLPTLGETLHIKGRDYAVRAYATKKAFAAALAKAVEAIDFPNFKAESERHLGREREGIYHSVWSTLRQLQK